MKTKSLRRKGGYRLKQTSPSRVRPKKSQMVIVDFFNLFLGVKRLVASGKLRSYYQFDYPDFLRVLTHEGHSLFGANIYIVQTGEFRVEQSRFLKRLSMVDVMEVEPIVDELWKNLDYKPELVDKIIRNQLQHLSSKADLITLVSGDGGYRMQLEELINRGKQVEVVAHSATIHGIYNDHPDIRVRSLEDIHSKMSRAVNRGDLRLKPLSMAQTKCGCI